MTDRTYVMTEIVGVSERSISEAISNAVRYADETIQALAWYEVKEVRGTISDGSVGEYQVVLDAGFRYLTDEEMRAWASS